MCIEILKNHVYCPHVRPMKSADFPTHVKYFYSCQRCAYNSRDIHYSLFQARRGSIIVTLFFIYFIKHHVERVLVKITFTIAQTFDLALIREHNMYVSHLYSTVLQTVFLRYLTIIIQKLYI